MINVRIDADGKSELHVEGSSKACLRESCIALVEICEALCETMGAPFDDVFGVVVQTAKALKSFKDNERDYENRT